MTSTSRNARIAGFLYLFLQHLSPPAVFTIMASLRRQRPVAK